MPVDIIEVLELDVGYPFSGIELICDDAAAEGPVTPPDPTSTNIITGNVSKLGMPFGIEIVAVSLSTIDTPPVVLARANSDAVTGDYSIDVYPETEEVLLYIAPDYGRAFTANFLAAEDQVFHPTVPNRHVYVALNAGALGDTEPDWSTEVDVVSGSVTLRPIPLHRPLMNGFIRPVITPI